MELRAATIIDREIEGHYGFFPLVEGISTRLHRHDFYEIFLIAEGAIQHHINGDVQHLSSGALVFIRPQDAHFYSRAGDSNCKLINLAFLSQTFAAVVAFLDFDRDVLMRSALPPTAYLRASDRTALTSMLQGWGRSLYQEKAQSRRQLRAIVAGMLSRHFLATSTTTPTAIPAWLREVTGKMRDPAHFIEGREALLRLANRTPEYVGRAFQEYLGVTPSQFINDLRLDYASDLLLYTDASPTDIAFEAGFGNVSHFYHLFKARWHCSPNQYRKQHQQTLIP